MNAPGRKMHRLIQREESLLVMIDLQERLVPAVAEREKVVENAVRLARFSRIIGLPVIVTEQQKLGRTLPEVVEALQNPDVVAKVDFNCFGEVAFVDAARKQLVNSLSQGLAIPKAEVLSLLEKAGVEPQKRAETLSLGDWARLERTFAEVKK